MKSYEINFTVDGKKISQEEIREVEMSRYQKVFGELFDRNIVLESNGRTYTREEIDSLDLEEAREVLACTKEKLGREKIRSIYAEDLAKGDEMWKEIAANSRAKENLQAGIVEVEAKGITLEQFMLCNQGLAKANNLYLPSKMHPEHYSFEAGPGGTQTIIETFGMYKYPAYLHLEPCNDGCRPIQPDEDTTMSMVGYTKLMSDGTDTKIIGMHQFKRSEDGIKVKLGVFVPEAAPKEIVEGHKWHLMVEFNNALESAAQEKPNAIQKKVLGLAIQKMKKKQQ
jgi:hypothetical protein